MSLTPENVITDADAVFMWTGWKTIWQFDRVLKGYQTCKIVLPMWTGADPNTGEQGTRNDTVLFDSLACYHDHIPDEVIVGSAGVFQPGAIEVIVYDTGILDSKCLIQLDSKWYKIIMQKYCDESGRNELTCNPYYD